MPDYNDFIRVAPELTQRVAEVLDTTFREIGPDLSRVGWFGLANADYVAARRVKTSAMHRHRPNPFRPDIPA